MSNFLRRAIVSLMLVIFTAIVIYMFPTWLFCVVITLFVGLGQLDFFRMVQHRKIFVYKYFGIVAGCLIPVVIFLGGGFPGLENLEPIMIVVACLFALTLQFARRDNSRDHLISAALTLFSLFYVAWLFSFFIKLKMLPNGSNLVAFLIIITKITDMGAYVVGSRFGRTELIPRISPKKTQEGTLGGILVSAIAAVTIGSVLTDFSVIHLFVLGIIIATIGQIGDLAESLIKRNCNVKDAGSYLGGIGGMLDLIDSLIFTVPVFYFYIKTL